MPELCSWRVERQPSSAVTLAISTAAKEYPIEQLPEEFFTLWWYPHAPGYTHIPLQVHMLSPVRIFGLTVGDLLTSFTSRANA